MTDKAGYVTVVVVTWQGAHLLPDCLHSLAAQTVAHRVLVVDNASTDGTGDLLAARYPDVEVLRLPENTGFAGGVAAALERVDTPFVALLNNDAAADPGWLAASVAALADPRRAAVTARMLQWADESRINNAGVRLVAGAYGADRGLGEPDGPPYDLPAEVFGFSGGAAVLRTDAVRAVGGMPAEFFLYYEDTDLAWRLRLAGHEVWYEPKAVVRHRHGASTGLQGERFAYFTERNRLLMLARCAPLGFAATQWLRFVLTTFSLVARRAVRQSVPDVAVFRFRVRARAFGGALRRSPHALHARRRTGAPGRRRKDVLDRWLEPQG